MCGRKVCWLGVVMVLLMAVQPLIKGYCQATANQTTRVPLTFELYRGYLIVVRGSAGPLKGRRFLLDTGASPTVLDSRLARVLHLDLQPAKIGGLNGSVLAGQAIVPSLGVGPMRRDNLPVLIEDLSFLEKALSDRIDAVIGLDVLGQGPFEIDYNSRRIHFDPVPPLANSLPLQLKNGLPIVDAELNHVSVHLLVDTGASSLILFEPKVPTSISRVKTSVVQESTNMIGEFERKQVWLPNLSLGGAKFGQEPASLVHSNGEAIQDFDGLLNPAALGITKVAIDAARGRLAFSR